VDARICAVLLTLKLHISLVEADAMLDEVFLTWNVYGMESDKKPEPVLMIWELIGKMI
jgi:hypothetical protein